MKRLLLTLTALALAALVGAVAFVWSGAYDISVTGQHLQPVYRLLETTMHQSVKRRARDTVVPELGGALRFERGAACYRAKCESCHGGPGVAPDDMGRSMQPLPGPLVDAAPRWSEAELHWIVREGIKMSGMPAWRFRMSDDDIWSVVAFLERLPQLTPADYRALPVRECDRETGPLPAADATPDATPDAARGRLALHQYACTACHLVPGVTGADVQVGPPLAGMASRQLVAGSLPNTPQNMVRWIRDPQGVDPKTAMPDLEVSERDARDMAAYLATLR
jgi:mono/diheme cytochrome c family protein